MLKSKEFNEIYRQVQSFNELLEKYSLNQKEANEETRVAIIHKYDKALRSSLHDLIKCKDSERKVSQCVADFKEMFIKLRSDTSLEIENLKNK